MKKLALATLLCSAFALSACGGDSGSDDETAPVALTKAEFTEQANAACAESEEGLEQAFHTLGDEPTEEQFLTFVAEQAVPALEKNLEDLRGLVAPAEIADDVTAMLDSLEAEIETAKQDPAYLAADESFSEASSMAEGLGLDDCA